MSGFAWGTSDAPRRDPLMERPVLSSFTERGKAHIEKGKGTRRRFSVPKLQDLHYFSHICIIMLGR